MDVAIVYRYAGQADNILRGSSKWKTGLIGAVFAASLSLSALAADGISSEAERWAYRTDAENDAYISGVCDKYRDI